MDIADEAVPAEDEPLFADRGYASTRRLTTTDRVAERSAEPGFVIVDLRSAEAYAEGHIPGAVHLPSRQVFQYDAPNGVHGMLPPPDRVGAAFGAAGITHESTLVFYDDSGGLWSARAVWSLAVLGHTDAKIVDGGWTKWLAEGRPTSGGAVRPKPVAYTFPGPGDPSLVAGWDEIVASIDDPAALVCDVRSAGEYEGWDSRAERSGHVPGAANVEWTRALAEDATFLPADDLRPIYADRGVTGDGVTYTMCQSGVRAAHTWFVLTDLLGYESVKMYDGSWTEYGNRLDSPIETSVDPS